MSALELGCIYALVALALFLSYRVLNIADMTTDGAFTLGCAVSATVAVAGHPLLALPAAMLAGLSAFAGIPNPKEPVSTPVFPSGRDRVSVRPGERCVFLTVDGERELCKVYREGYRRTAGYLQCDRKRRDQKRN